MHLYYNADVTGVYAMGAGNATFARDIHAVDLI